MYTTIPILLVLGLFNYYNIYIYISPVPHCPMNKQSCPLPLTVKHCIIARVKIEERSRILPGIFQLYVPPVAYKHAGTLLCPTTTIKRSCSQTILSRHLPEIMYVPICGIKFVLTVIFLKKYLHTCLNIRE